MLGSAGLASSPKDGSVAISLRQTKTNPLMDVADVSWFSVIGLDVWEHHYYLKFQKQTPRLYRRLWNVI